MNGKVTLTDQPLQMNIEAEVIIFRPLFSDQI